MSFLQEPIGIDPFLARPRDQGLGVRAAPEPAIASKSSAATSSEASDAEMLEILQKFDELYTEAAIGNEAQQQAPASDAFNFEFPDESAAAADTFRPVLQSGSPETRRESVAGHEVPAWRGTAGPIFTSRRDRRFRFHTILVSAVVVALGLGAILGHTVAKRSPSQATSATIRASAEGGAELRLDYQLGRSAPAARKAR